MIGSLLGERTQRGERGIIGEVERGRELAILDKLPSLRGPIETSDPIRFAIPSRTDLSLNNTASIRGRVILAHEKLIEASTLLIPFKIDLSFFVRVESTRNNFSSNVSKILQYDIRVRKVKTILESTNKVSVCSSFSKSNGDWKRCRIRNATRLKISLRHRFCP